VLFLYGGRRRRRREVVCWDAAEILVVARRQSEEVDEERRKKKKLFFKQRKNGCKWAGMTVGRRVCCWLLVLARRLKCKKKLTILKVYMLGQKCGIVTCHLTFNN
jgi:hypothetical protein